MTKNFTPAKSRTRGDQRSWATIEWILGDVQSIIAQGESVQVAVDLDSTLINTSYRTANIFHEYSLEPEHVKSYPWLCKSISEWQNVREVFYPEEFVAEHVLGSHSARGGGDKQLRNVDGQEISSLDFAIEAPLGASLRDWWFRRFFQPSYLCHDRAYMDASAFLLAVISLGADLVYLTGRDHERMYKATVMSISQFGFPFGRSVCLQLKPRGETDVAYKMRCLEKYSRKYSRVYFIDNEVALIEAALTNQPKVHSIHFDSVHSGKSNLSEGIVPAIQSWVPPSGKGYTQWRGK